MRSLERVWRVFCGKDGKATNFVVRGGRGEVRKEGRRRKKERWKREKAETVTKFGEGARGRKKTKKRLYT